MTRGKVMVKRVNKKKKKKKKIIFNDNDDDDGGDGIKKKENYQTKLRRLESSRRTAWRRYFDMRDEMFSEMRAGLKLYEELKKVQTQLSVAGQPAIPVHIMNRLKELEKKSDCAICLDVIKKDDFHVTKCGHYYHYQCLKQAHEHKKECPLCRKPIRNL